MRKRLLFTSASGNASLSAAILLCCVVCMTVYCILCWHACYLSHHCCRLCLK